MKPARRFWPVAIIILLPVLLLAAGVLYGVREYEKRWHRDQKAMMEPVLEEIYQEYHELIHRTLEASPPVYPEPQPPVPQTPTGIAQHLEKLGEQVAHLAAVPEAEYDAAFNSTWMALMGIRDDLELDRNRTGSGLPVRTMAAWHMWTMTESREDGEALGRVALECPSVLTDVFLAKMLEAAEQKAPGADWHGAVRKAWDTSRDRRWVVEAALAPMGSSIHHRREFAAGEAKDFEGYPTMCGLEWPEIAPGEYGLILTNPDRTEFFRDHAGKIGLWVVSRCEKAADPVISRTAIRTLSPEELKTLSDQFIARVKNEHMIPAWAELFCPDLEPDVMEANLGVGLWNWITRGTSQDGTPQIAFRIRDPKAYEQGYHTIRKWAVWLIGTAALTSLTGLLFTSLILRKERSLSELKSQFVSSVSHELRAPIGSMRLMAEGLASGRVQGEAAGEFHRLMAGEGARLSALIENVLDFARIEQGRKEYVMAETDMTALLTDAVALMQPQAEAKGLRILLECEPLPFVPRVDAGAVQQAVINLLDNAVKFTPSGGAKREALSGLHGEAPPGAPASPPAGTAMLEGTAKPGGGGHGEAAGTAALPGVRGGGRHGGALPGEIVVKLAPMDGAATASLSGAALADCAGWAISVTDPGIGIPAAEHGRIFERFYRLGNELRRETTGTGIGLAIVKHIAEGHGGTIRVESEPGQGSKFRMEFSVRSVQFSARAGGSDAGAADSGAADSGAAGGAAAGAEPLKTEN